jgi:hypothetical protein
MTTLRERIKQTTPIKLHDLNTGNVGLRFLSDEIIDAVLRALQSSGTHKIVPVMPTAKMKVAADAKSWEKLQSEWDAMLKSAPDEVE